MLAKTGNNTDQRDETSPVSCFCRTTSFAPSAPLPPFPEEEEEEDSFPQEGEIEGGGAGDKLLLKRWPKP